VAIRFFQSVIGVYWFGIFICGASELIFIIIFLGGRVNQIVVLFT
tara:strand:+ start:2867 stop:3001 length:135 start_codon:yes stop_codon:yes gene_type:complete